MDLYLSKLPKYGFEQDILYLRSKCTTPHDPDAAWYEKALVGKNSLSTMVKDMCGEANIVHVGKTNHSLRATGATTLFQKNVPERIVQKVTGHRSLEALHSYERISVSQNQEVSKILMTNVQSQSVANVQIPGWH